MNKKFARGALSTLAVAGVLVALWPLGQTAYSQWNQKQLRESWEKQARNGKTGNGKQKTENGKPARKVATSQKPKPQNPQSAIRNPQSNWPSTRIVIPDAGTDVVVLDGWDESTLARAPGHLPSSAQPGQKGNCVIAGHRNVYGSPFYKVDQLMGGAPIELRTPDATYTYYVVSVFGVTDSDQTVLQPPADPNANPQLTLITCTIPRTSNRIIVVAEMAQS